MHDHHFPTPRQQLTTPFQSLLAHLTKHEWTCETDDEQKVFQAAFSTHEALFRMAGTINEEDDLLQMITFLPNGAPPEKRQEVAEFCVRLNCWINVGKLQLNFEEGTLGWHVSAPFEPGQLGDHTIEYLINNSVRMVQLFYPALMSLLYGSISAKEAMDMVEQAARRHAEETEGSSWSA